MRHICVLSLSLKSIVGPLGCLQQCLSKPHPDLGAMREVLLSSCLPYAALLVPSLHLLRNLEWCLFVSLIDSGCHIEKAYRLGSLERGR